MKSNIALIASLLLNVALVANTIRQKNSYNELVNLAKDNVTQCDDVDSLKAVWDKREYQLLTENGALVSQVNDLTTQLSKKPQYIKIYNDEKSSNISDSQSEFYNGILSRRYSAE